MQLDFRTHKKSKSFPFPLFGWLFLLSLVGVFIYLTINNVNLRDVFSQSSDVIYLNVFYFTSIILHTLFSIFSVGIIKQLRTNLKYLLYIALFIFFICGILSGYFYNTTAIFTLQKYCYLSALLYFIIYLITFVFQNISFSKYISKIVFIFSIIPIFPLLLMNFIVLTDGLLTDLNFLNANYVYLATLLLYVGSNSFYLTLITRRI